MTPHCSTPFGRRSLTLAHVATQASAKARPLDKPVLKWTVFKAVCAVITKIGVSERALSVLNALLSCHRDKMLIGDCLTVYPSNKNLRKRANVNSETSLRRYLAELIDAGLIIRRDSPNGKRYPCKGQGGAIEGAFGFDLSPLVARADEFDALADESRREEMAFKKLRADLTLFRRNIAKMIATGAEENVCVSEEDGFSGWSEIHAFYRSIIDGIPRSPAREVLEAAAVKLSQLAALITALLDGHVNAANLVGNAAQIGGHIQSQNSNHLFDLESGCREENCSQPQRDPSNNLEPLGSSPALNASILLDNAFSLDMILRVCPDINHHAKGGVKSWSDLLATASYVATLLQISPSAWQKAQDIMGEIAAAIVVAAILQRATGITNPGGYLHKLTEETNERRFRLASMVMPLIHGQKKKKDCVFVGAVESPRSAAHVDTTDRSRADGLAAANAFMRRGASETPIRPSRLLDSPLFKRGLSSNRA